MSHQNHIYGLPLSLRDLMLESPLFNTDEEFTKLAGELHPFTVIYAAEKEAPSGIADQLKVLLTSPTETLKDPKLWDYAKLFIETLINFHGATGKIPPISDDAKELDPSLQKGDDFNKKYKELPHAVAAYWLSQCVTDPSVNQLALIKNIAGELAKFNKPAILNIGKKMLNIQNDPSPNQSFLVAHNLSVSSGQAVLKGVTNVVRKIDEGIQDIAIETPHVSKGKDTKPSMAQRSHAEALGKEVWANAKMEVDKQVQQLKKAVADSNKLTIESSKLFERISMAFAASDACGAVVLDNKEGWDSIRKELESIAIMCPTQVALQKMYKVPRKAIEQFSQTLSAVISNNMVLAKLPKYYVEFGTTSNIGQIMLQGGIPPTAYTQDPKTVPTGTDAKNFNNLFDKCSATAMATVQSKMGGTPDFPSDDLNAIMANVRSKDALKSESTEIAARDLQWAKLFRSISLSQNHSPSKNDWVQFITWAYVALFAYEISRSTKRYVPLLNEARGVIKTSWNVFPKTLKPVMDHPNQPPMGHPSGKAPKAKKTYTPEEAQAVSDAIKSGYEASDETLNEIASRMGNTEQVAQEKSKAGDLLREMGQEIVKSGIDFDVSSPADSMLARLARDVTIMSVCVDLRRFDQQTTNSYYHQAVIDCTSIYPEWKDLKSLHSISSFANRTISEYNKKGILLNKFLEEFKKRVAGDPVIKEVVKADPKWLAAPEMISKEYQKQGVKDVPNYALTMSIAKSMVDLATSQRNYNPDYVVNVLLQRCEHAANMQAAPPRNWWQRLTGERDMSRPADALPYEKPSKGDIGQEEEQDVEPVSKLPDAPTGTWQNPVVVMLASSVLRVLNESKKGNYLF